MKAVILAAGIASRLRPLTDTTPKCLLKVGERCLLQRAFDALLQNGFREFVIVTGYSTAADCELSGSSLSGIGGYVYL